MIDVTKTILNFMEVNGLNVRRITVTLNSSAKLEYATGGLHACPFDPAEDGKHIATIYKKTLQAHDIRFFGTKLTFRSERVPVVAMDTGNILQGLPNAVHEIEILTFSINRTPCK